MPAYTIPAPRANAQSTDPWADLAKSFMTQPGFADNYMAQAQRPPIRPSGSGGAHFEGLPNMTDRDLLAGALTAEGSGLEDMHYITNVIHNRIMSGAHPGTLRDVILAPGQFSAFNEVTGYAGGQGANNLWQRPTEDAYSIADAYFNGALADATGGALNYYNPSLASPAWGGEEFAYLPGSKHVFGTAR